MIARRPESAVYAQLADILRTRIIDGTYPAGGLFPSENRLMQEYGHARDTVRRATRELRNEGLIVVEPGRDTRVRLLHEVQTVRLPAGVAWSVRMPTPTEVRTLALAASVPVVVVEIDGGTTLYPGDRYRFITG
jgi:DNA-binding FadR family transcriptional regulator